MQSYKYKMRQIFVLISFASILLFNINAVGQSHVCGTDEHYKSLWEANPKLKEIMKANEISAPVPEYQLSNSRADKPKLIVPCVFHIIHNNGTENISKDRVYQALDFLNSCLAGTNNQSSVRAQFRDLIAQFDIEFRLATIDPNGNCTDGITRTESELTSAAGENVKSLINWNTLKYFNIWVVENIDREIGIPGTVLGYAQFPTDPNNQNFGIVIRADNINANSTTLTHEVGHCLGLFHPFQDGCGAENSDCELQGDGVCDTPPSAEPNFGCNRTLNSCDFDPRLDNIENFMDYSSCGNMFTIGQDERARRLFALKSFLYSEANLQKTGALADARTIVCKPTADYYIGNTTACANGTIQFFQNSTNNTEAQYEWTFTNQNGTVVTASGESPRVDFLEPGIYTLKLRAFTTAGEDIIEEEKAFEIFPEVSNLADPRGYDFEYSGQFDEPGFIRNEDQNGLAWQVGFNAGFRGLGSAFLNSVEAEEGFTYSFQLPPYDVTAADEKVIRFKLATARRFPASSDILRVRASINCGQTFTNLRQLSGDLLYAASKRDYSAPFTPDPTEWQDVTIDIPSTFRNARNLIIRFDVENRQGNNMYIDLVGIGSQSWVNLNSIDKKSSEVEIYPIPANDIINITSNNNVSNAIIKVYNVQGQLLKTINNINLSSNPISFSPVNLNINAAGVYNIKIESQEQVYVRQIIIKN